jgi:putative oxidoreductase
MARHSPSACRCGFAVFLSGRSKLFAPERREQMRQKLVEAHIPFPDFNALFVSTVEFVCGLLLVLGALTPLVCALLAFVMIVAIATKAIRDIKASSITEWLAAFCIYLSRSIWFIWLFFAGPGWLSVDHLLLSQSQIRL